MVIPSFKVLRARLGNVAWHLASRVLASRARDLARSGDWRAKGRFGERVAAIHLACMGCRIIARNWRGGGEELDIVCRDGRTLVVAEVRTRLAGRFLAGGWSVGAAKREHLRRAVLLYLATWGRRRPASWRIEILEVALGGEQGVEVHRWRMSPEEPRPFPVPYRRH